MTEIRIYVEGGGDSGDNRARLRQGLSSFFNSVVAIARVKRVHWNIIPCGSRQSCYEDFCNALISHPTAFNILLVDSEFPVEGGRCDHLRNHDKWPIAFSENHCHLMAQTMESWLIADRSTMQSYYGSRFQDSAIPNIADVEQIAKSDLEKALYSATRHTQKGEYHKIQHGAELLKLIDPILVRQRARHCEILFSTLEEHLDNI